MISTVIDLANTYVFGPGLCIAVFFCGVYLLFRLKPFFITHPKKTASALKSSTANGISPIRAMILALAGTLGVGNIAGVASAIAIGGAGAVFWMLVSALAAIPIKYAEIVLAVCHRRRDKSGKPHGGAYFYIEERGTRAAKFLAAFFAVLCLLASLSMGCAVQSNAIAVSMESALGFPPIVCGIIVCVLTLTVASGGLSRISLLTEKLIPLISGAYIIMSLYVILTNASLLKEVTADIVGGAFSPDALGGGIIGFLTSRALRIGVTRGIVSNEAGCGTAPIAHASAEVKSPAAQGIWGMCEVAIDTIVICTLTALVVLIGEKRGVALSMDGMVGAVSAFGRFIPLSDLILCVFVAVFAFCTIVCWFYYGSESLSYLTKSRRAGKIYLAIYSLCAFLGCVSKSTTVWGFSDLAISVMCAVNLVAVMLSCREIKDETNKYFEKPQCNIVNTDIPILHNTVAKSRKL